MFSEEKAIEDLVAIYDESFKRITKRIVNSKIEGKSTYSDARILSDIKKLRDKLIIDNNYFSEKVVSNVYGRTQEEVIEKLKQSGIIGKQSDKFLKVHNDAIKELVKNLKNNLNNQVINIGRKSKDTLKRITEKSAIMRTAGATTKEESINQTTEMFIKRGIDKVVYKNGAVTNIKDYVRMATRTVMDASINKATINQALEYEVNLVQMSFHSTSCPICAPYQGRVYCIEGSKGYPNINTINSGAIVEYGVVHPNCHHRMLPYIKKLDKNSAEVKVASNKEFSDNRTEWSKKRYNRRQDITRFERKTRRLKEENELLSKIKGAEDKIKKNKEMISRAKKEIGKIKAWEIDGMKNNELFTN